MSYFGANRRYVSSTFGEPPSIYSCCSYCKSHHQSSICLCAFDRFLFVPIRFFHFTVNERACPCSSNEVHFHLYAVFWRASEPLRRFTFTAGIPRDCGPLRGRCRIAKNATLLRERIGKTSTPFDDDREHLIRLNSGTKFVVHEEEKRTSGGVE